MTPPATERTLDAMADDYSRRARQARVEQKRTAILTSPTVLDRLVDLMSAPVETLNNAPSDAA